MVKEGLVARQGGVLPYAATVVVDCVRLETHGDGGESCEGLLVL